MKLHFVYLLISFLLISTNFFCQKKIKKEEFLGNWVKIKTEMKDGSRLIAIYKGYIKQFEMTFQKNKFYKDYYPAQYYRNATFDYKLKNNKLITSKHFAYKIEKLTKDSLVISEEMKGVESDKLKRHYLIKKQSIISRQKELNKDSSELIANFFFTPKFKDNIKLYLNNMLMKRHINLKLKGKILLDTKNKKVETKITYRDIENISMQENILVNALNNSYTLWDIKGFENYENIIINFVIIMNRKGKKSYGIKVGLLTNSFEQALGLYGLSYNQITNGNKFLSLGIKSIENKEYKKAIEYFTKSFKSNHTLVESLYNRAFCLYKLKEYNKACEDWNILKELGQKKGEKLFKKNCKIIE
ncbi:tetratricopeptide repeat protein [Polaribacter aquimarinus]|uniref:Uncharacterized protein n=1 Tax=Polaribacter aquimarinus TaxID=2100726 RepID=A0A2U2JDR5_9FLAO|nr:hypothetical protein [Polaribacter aquimarinus]PWG06477.1 hypothetical protein DIS07_01195 [Polaribacter aquimarinus]